MTAPTSGRNLHQIRDPHLGLILGAVDLPAGWTAMSGVTWRPDWPSNPVSSWARTADPVTQVGIDFLPAQSYAWLEPNPGMIARGASFGGQTSLPPAPATETLTQRVIPQMLGPTARVIEVGSDPELIERLQAPQQLGTRFEAVTAKVELPGLSERWYGLAFYRVEPPQYGPMGPLTQTNWGFYRLVVFHAPTGMLDEHVETLWAVVDGLKINPAWEKKAAATMNDIAQGATLQMAHGYADIAAAGQISRQISADNNAMIADMDATRFAYNLAEERLRHAQLAARDPTSVFDEAIRGVQTMNDPLWGTSQQDASAAYV